MCVCVCVDAMDNGCLLLSIVVVVVVCCVNIAQNVVCILLVLGHTMRAQHDRIIMMCVYN